MEKEHHPYQKNLVSKTFCHLMSLMSFVLLLRVIAGCSPHHTAHEPHESRSTEPKEELRQEVPSTDSAVSDSQEPERSLELEHVQDAKSQPEKTEGSDAKQVPDTSGTPNVLQLIRSPSGYLFAEVEVTGPKGSKKVHALIDFGDPTPFSISTSLAKQIGIELTSTGQKGFHADGKQFSIFTGTVTKLVVGSAVIENKKTHSGEGELEFVGSQIGFKFDVTIGWGFIGQHTVLLEYKANRLSLFQSSTIDVNPAFVVTANHSSYLRLPVKLNGKPAQVILDTGVSASVIDRGAGAQIGLPTSNGGVVTLQMDVGSYQTKQSFVIQELPVLSQLATVAVLGGDFLQQWDLVIPKGKRTLSFFKPK